MGYQALLFCTDEKLARVVSQLFSELEFSVSAVTDPFAAVKNLMAQHYDAVVIDCENEQGASLMIKSARNSTFNQGSLAIGLVEGQVGVAKAYRMGANLVLTKPINVEAAKGTLRVARGLLRKGTDASAGGQANSVPGVAAHSSASSFALTNPTMAAAPVASVQTSGSQYRPGENPSETAAQAMPYPAFANSEATPGITPGLPIKPWTSIGSTVPVGQAPATPAKVSFPLAPARPLTPEQIAARLDASRPAAAPTVNANTKTQGTAAGAAPAPAKVAASAQQPVYEEEREEFAEDADWLPTAESLTKAAAIPAPTFSMETEHSSRPASSQKILVGAVAVLLVIGGYFGWTKFGKSPSSPVPVASAPQAPPDAGSSLSTPAQPLTSPAVTGRQASSTQPNHSPVNTSSTTQTSTTPVFSAPAPSTHSAPTQASAPSESPEIKSGAAPILVKSGATARTRAQTQNQNEEASAQLPGPLDVVTPSQNGLSGVLTASSVAAKPSLAKIRLSQGVSQGLLIKRVEPQYPRNALMTHTQGAVQIEATVDKEGRVVNPKVVSGPFMLAPAALEAVRQWRYKPYYLDGEPVEVQTQITINFKAQ